ncbi:MAG TPA: ribonuclease P protein component [Thermoanaerobaculia bacterium]|nr:ribonuclease P protein component [Thermoanaerobaculia bacterium]
MRPGHKLHAAAEFERARRARDRLTDAMFVIQYAANETSSARLGMAVSTRAAGQSVNRNRLRRLIRESFRMHREELPAVDLLETARAGSAKATNAEIFDSLAKAWRAIGAAR